MKVAFIIPIHPKHYNYIYSFLDIIYNNNIIIDIYLVFSNDDDYNIFIYKDRIKKIIMSDINTNSIVTYKKFYGLKQLKDDINYDYFIVCDAEISIIPENFNELNMINKIKNIYDNKIVYAGEVKYSEFIKDITMKSTSLICNDNRLKDITLDYILYFWWSDLPVYKRDHLDDFFNKFEYNDITMLHFDHVIYLSYLLLYQDFTITNVTKLINHNFSLESYNTNNKLNLDILKSNGYGFSYITPHFYNNQKDYLLLNGSFLLYHLDR